MHAIEELTASQKRESYQNTKNKIIHRPIRRNCLYLGALAEALADEIEDNPTLSCAEKLDLRESTPSSSEKVSHRSTDQGEM